MANQITLHPEKHNSYLHLRRFPTLWAAVQIDDQNFWNGFRGTCTPWGLKAESWGCWLTNQRWWQGKNPCVFRKELRLKFNLNHKSFPKCSPSPIRQRNSKKMMWYSKLNDKQSWPIDDVLNLTTWLNHAKNSGLEIYSMNKHTSSDLCNAVILTMTKLY